MSIEQNMIEQRASARGWFRNRFGVEDAPAIKIPASPAVAAEINSAQVTPQAEFSAGSINFDNGIGITALESPVVPIEEVTRPIDP